MEVQPIDVVRVFKMPMVGLLELQVHKVCQVYIFDWEFVIDSFFNDFASKELCQNDATDSVKVESIFAELWEKA